MSGRVTNDSSADLTHATSYDYKGDSAAMNSYGTDDPEAQAHIENARIDAARERKQSREKLKRMVELGVNADDAETVVEFQDYIGDLQIGELGGTAPQYTGDQAGEQLLSTQNADE